MANEPPKTSSKFITNPSFRRYFIDEIDCFEAHIDRETFSVSHLLYLHNSQAYMIMFFIVLILSILSIINMSLILYLYLNYFQISINVDDSK